MLSLRPLAACIGFQGDFRVVADFFGYASAPPWILAPSQANLPQSLSLLAQMQRLKQNHFHLNIIRVGTDANGLLPAMDEQNADCAVQITRDIYAAAGVGIGRVERWWMIPLSANTGYDVIDDDSEAEDLVDEYSVPNPGVDCFFVLDYVGSTAGAHPGKGDGVVVESRENNFLGTARTMAHELGHFFGLDHRNDQPNNLMCQTSSANPMPGSTELDGEQIGDIVEEDSIFNAC
jgi:hypothetical protein